MERILVTSDMHGLYMPLLELLQFAEYDHSQDSLYLLGDYLSGKHEHDHAALATVETLVHDGAVALLGNTEVEWMSRRGRLPDEAGWGAFLASLSYYRLESHFLFVHAGIRPGVPLERQRKDDLVYIRKPFLDKSFVPRHTVVFGHTPTHKLGSPGEVYVGPNKIGIDTGAKHGRRMSIVDLSEGTVFSCTTDRDGRTNDFRRMRHGGLEMLVRKAGR